MTMLGHPQVNDDSLTRMDQATLSEGCAKIGTRNLKLASEHLHYQLHRLIDPTLRCLPFVKPLLRQH